jgi:hypothetical protein
MRTMKVFRKENTRLRRGFRRRLWLWRNQTARQADGTNRTNGTDMPHTRLKPIKVKIDRSETGFCHPSGVVVFFWRVPVVSAPASTTGYRLPVLRTGGLSDGHQNFNHESTQMNTNGNGKTGKCSVFSVHIGKRIKAN